MAISLTSVPESGIKSINGVVAPTSNIDLISSDNSVTIVPNPTSKEIDLTVAGNGVTFTATCDASVYINAAVVSDGIKLINGLADGSTSTLVLGIVESKPNATTAVVRFTGLSAPVFSGLDYTKEYFLSDTIPGAITTTTVTTPGHYLIKIGVPLNTQRLIVNTHVVARRT